MTFHKKGWSYVGKDDKNILKGKLGFENYKLHGYKTSAVIQKSLELGLMIHGCYFEILNFFQQVVPCCHFELGTIFYVASPVLERESEINISSLLSSEPNPRVSEKRFWTIV